MKAPSYILRHFSSVLHRTYILWKGCVNRSNKFPLIFLFSCVLQTLATTVKESSHNKTKRKQIRIHRNFSRNEKRKKKEVNSILWLHKRNTIFLSFRMAEVKELIKNHQDNVEESSFRDNFLNFLHGKNGTLINLCKYHLPIVLKSESFSFLYNDRKSEPLFTQI